MSNVDQQALLLELENLIRTAPDQSDIVSGAPDALDWIARARAAVDLSPSFGSRMECARLADHCLVPTFLHWRKKIIRKCWFLYAKHVPI